MPDELIPITDGARHLRSIVISRENWAGIQEEMCEL